MPMADYITCGSQYIMKMWGFLLTKQEKVPKTLKYKILSLFCSFFDTVIVFSICLLGEYDLHRDTGKPVLQLSACVYMDHQLQHILSY